MRLDKWEYMGQCDKLGNYGCDKWGNKCDKWGNNGETWGVTKVGRISSQ